MSENYFMGLDGFVWFTGVVEDRNDPFKIGRVRVRCLGYHTPDKEKIPTSTFDDVINFFEHKEDYEKCKVLYEFIKHRKE